MFFAAAIVAYCMTMWFLPFLVPVVFAGVAFVGILRFREERN